MKLKSNCWPPPAPILPGKQGWVGGLGEGCYPGVGATQSQSGQLRAGSGQAASKGDNSCLHLVYQALPPQTAFPLSLDGKL